MPEDKVALGSVGSLDLKFAGGFATLSLDASVLGGAATAGINVSLSSTAFLELLKNALVKAVPVSAPIDALLFPALETALASIK